MSEPTREQILAEMAAGADEMNEAGAAIDLDLDRRIDAADDLPELTPEDEEWCRAFFLGVDYERRRAAGDTA